MSMKSESSNGASVLVTKGAWLVAVDSRKVDLKLLVQGLLGAEWATLDLRELSPQFSEIGLILSHSGPIFHV